MIIFFPQVLGTNNEIKKKLCNMLNLNKANAHVFYCVGGWHSDVMPCHLLTVLLAAGHARALTAYWDS